LEEKLEVTGALLRSLLRDELRIRGDAVENLPYMGNHHAMPFYYPNYRKLKESPKNEWMKYYFE
jgi:hypothetical protein